METNTEETKDQNVKEIEDQNASPKITSVVKEKIKDPRRVAQGKKLAATSREAKARKAKEREAAIHKEESDRCEEENYSNASYAIIPVIGIALFGGYYFLYRDRKDDESKNPNLEKF